MLCCTRRKRLAVFLISSFCLVFCIVPAFADAPTRSTIKGGYWIEGNDNLLGHCFVLTGVNSGWCLSDGGYLARFGTYVNNAVILKNNGQMFTLYCDQFDTPYYYDNNISSSRHGLNLKPIDSNIVISDDFEPVYSPDQTVNYIVLFILGLGVIVLLIKR